MTRVTSEMMVTGSLRRLSTRLQQYERTQVRLATGKRIQAPSEAPGDANRALGLRAAQRARQQELRNAGDAKSWLDITDTQLQAGMERLGRVRELTLRGASSAGDLERSALAMELRNIRDELVGIANYRSMGRPLFAGFADGDAVSNVAGTWTYTGDHGNITRRVSESDIVDINVTASEVFGFGGAAGSDLFSVLDRLIADLEAGNGPGVTAAIGDIDAARMRMGDMLAKVGAAANTVESARMRTDNALLAVKTELSDVEDVDLAEAVMELQTQQTAYEATLQALGRSLPATLGAFLR